MKYEMKFSILLVEDDMPNLNALASILSKKFPEVELFTATNGRKGFESFQTNLPDIVISDINMPEMNGLVMIDKIRAIRPKIRFIFLTGDSGNTILQDWIEREFSIDHFIQKPVIIKELFAVIERCLSEIARQP